MDWSLRACGRRGHATYAPAEPDLRERLVATTPEGEAWRCLRCGDFVLGAAAGSGPAAEAPLVLRDRALRDAVVLRLLAVERFLRGLVLLGLAYGVLRFRAAQSDLRATFERAVPALQPLQEALHVDLTDSAAVARAQKILESRPHTLTLLSVGLLAYGLLQLLEGVGLFLLKRWGEYVAAVGTSIFLPLEVRELLDRVTVLRIGALVINVAAVLYLVLTKRLFGVRGGHAAFEAARRQESLLEVQQAATG
ncbi:MAG: putative rane protein [Frankiales bacterium]|nr:putative rane protein [Frankiales bacterium]